MKQTAVQFLWIRLFEIKKTVPFDEQNEAIIKAYYEAKAMEKEQITNAYSNGRVDEQFKGTNASFYRKTSEQYYNETFKSE